MKINMLFILTLSLTISMTVSLNQYYLSSYEYVDSAQSHMRGVLDFIGDFNVQDYDEIKWKNTSSTSIYPITKLNIDVNLECDEILHIKVTDAEKGRWEVPYTISDEYKAEVEKCKSTKSLKSFGFDFETDSTRKFSFTLKDNSGDVYYATENVHFLYSNNFIIFGGYITSDDIFGFGERYRQIKLGTGRYTIWPRDPGSLIPDPESGGGNLMGSHPLGIHRTKQGKYIGLIFNNINAQDIVINKRGIDQFSFEHRTVGGIIDYYFYVGQNIDDTLIHMHKVIGHPILPPYWSLGYHQSRFGFRTTAEVRTLYNKYRDNVLPVDTIWGDIDIISGSRNFDLDNNFRDLPDLIADMHSNNYHFVPIVELALVINDDDECYARGKADSFVLSNYTKENLVTYVWLGYSVFPDFFTQPAVDLWHYGLDKFYTKVKYDGIWLDMNEPAMIKAPEGRGEFLNEGQTFDPEYNSFDFIPYIPGGLSSLEERSLSVNAKSHEFNENNHLYAYNFKPLIPYLQGKVTNDHLTQNMNKRAFILSRSTPLGAGKKVFHWLGDNHSIYRDMKYGIEGIYQFQIYGIPMTGDDIGGFNGQANDTIAAKWMALGAFYPFMRNHNAKGMVDQDPFAFGMDSKTLQVSKKVLPLRYSLLRYIYSQMFLISLGKSGSFFKPLFFEFPNDLETFKYTSQSIMVGNSLHLVPCITDSDSMTGYFPNADWMEFQTRKVYKTYDPIATTGTTETYTFDYQDVKLFMRGGYIVPSQDVSKVNLYNSDCLHVIPTDLIIQPDSVNHEATGTIVFDNDEVNTLADKTYNLVNMEFKSNTLSFTKQNTFPYYTSNDMTVGLIKFCRMGYFIQQVKHFDARVTDANGKKFNVSPTLIDSENFDLDLTKLGLKYTTIASISLLEGGNNNTGAIIGIVLGVIVFIGCIVGFILWRRKHKKQNSLLNLDYSPIVNNQ